MAGKIPEGNHKSCGRRFTRSNISRSRGEPYSRNRQLPATRLCGKLHRVCTRAREAARHSGKTMGPAEAMDRESGRLYSAKSRRAEDQTGAIAAQTAGESSPAGTAS